MRFQEFFLPSQAPLHGLSSCAKFTACCCLQQPFHPVLFLWPGESQGGESVCFHHGQRTQSSVKKAVNNTSLPAHLSGCVWWSEPIHACVAPLPTAQFSFLPWEALPFHFLYCSLGKPLSLALSEYKWTGESPRSRERVFSYPMWRSPIRKMGLFSLPTLFV